MRSNAVGHNLIGIANIIRRVGFDYDHEKNHSPTTMQNFFLGVIYCGEKGGKEIYQKDLEAEFSLRRSTASGILSLMEQNGYILRTPSEHDARLKVLHLTERSREMCERRHEFIQKFEKKLTEGFSQEELDKLLDLLARIRENALSVEKSEDIL